MGLTSCIKNRSECECSCHTNPGMVHIMSCCENVAMIQSDTEALIEKLNKLLDRAIDDKFEQVDKLFEQDRDRGDENNE